jgi:hypothetical protein
MFVFRATAAISMKIFTGAFLCIALLAAVPLRAQIDSFRVVGVHPGAAAQSTAIGRIINTLAEFDGMLYAGYGDYSANTGPIAITSLDPGTGIFTELAQANSEAVYNYRTIRGRLLAPSIDRKSNTEPGDYIERNADGSWENRDVGGLTTHAYDMATLQGNDLWLAGAFDTKATLWRSTNDGADWSIALQDTALSGSPDDFCRFYFAGVLDGKLYVQTRDALGGLHPRSRMFDGSSWSDGPDLFPGFSNALGWRPDTFAGRMVYRSREPRTSYSQLFSFDGTTARWHDAFWVYDFTIDGGSLYAVADSGLGIIRIMRTEDLQTWTSVAQAPATTRSIAVVDGTIYVGTTRSELLQFVGRFATAPDVPIAGSSFQVRSTNSPSGFEVEWNESAERPSRFAIHDLLGRAIGSGVIEKGSHTLPWKPDMLATGAYFLSLYNQHGRLLTTIEFVR